MNLPRTLLALSTVTATFAAYAQADADAPTPAAAANASVALNNGGNPAGAMGSAILNSDTVPNSAPLIVGNAGTTGVNGLTGSDAAASSVHGTDIPAIGSRVETIGMRRERLNSTSLGDTAVPADVTLGANLAAGSIRSVSIDGRHQLGAQLERNIAAGRQAIAVAESQARTLDPDARANFETAARAVATAERRLLDSISAAQSASSSEWPRAREALAADYDSYAQAVAHAQRVAAAGSARNSTALGRR
jgi:hypothetical protein